MGTVLILESQTVPNRYALNNYLLVLYNVVNHITTACLQLFYEAIRENNLGACRHIFFRLPNVHLLFSVYKTAASRSCFTNLPSSHLHKAIYYHEVHDKPCVGVCVRERMCGEGGSERVDTGGQGASAQPRRQ